MPGTDFNISPFIAIWEVTQACGLVCRHCRAEARDERDPGELTTEEGIRLIDEIADLGARILVLSGGDPLRRPDLDDLVRRGKSRGMRVATIPAATSLLTSDRIARLKAAGLEQVAMSLDASTAAKHDEFRKVAGVFQQTMEGARLVHEQGLKFQLNTVFGAWNFDDFDALSRLVEQLKIVFWEVFFLVPTGRGSELDGLSPGQFEVIFGKLRELQQRAPFIVKVTEAPHYRMFVAEKEKRAAGPGGNHEERVRHLLARETGPHGSMGQAPRGVNAGKGIVFISHVGDVFPSGFVPIVAGNIREDSLAEVYRDSPLFRQLRDPEQLKGKCGTCEYRELCGGCRSRAYALTGDILAEDDACLFEPRKADWRI